MEQSTPQNPSKQPGDRPLANAVAAALDADGRLADCRILVAVSRGTVTLSGFTPLEFQRELSITLASAVGGVLLVIPQLTVGETSDD